MALNATWLLVTQADWVWASVVVIVALLVNLLVLVSRLGREPASGVPERIVADGTFGGYLGWVTVATAANLAAKPGDDILLLARGVAAATDRLVLLKP